jgi:hypothetical protein
MYTSRHPLEKTLLGYLLLMVLMGKMEQRQSLEFLAFLVGSGLPIALVYLRLM